MLCITKNARIFLYGKTIDLRIGFEGLITAIQYAFNDRIDFEAYYVFLNKRRNRIKVLYWNGNNLAIWYTRSRKGVFAPREFIKTSINRNEFKRILKGKSPQYLCTPK